MSASTYTASHKNSYIKNKEVIKNSMKLYYERNAEVIKQKRRLRYAKQQKKELQSLVVVCRPVATQWLGVRARLYEPTHRLGLAPTDEFPYKG